MPLLDLPQRSDAWLEARRGRITASLAAACIGLDPYRGLLGAYNAIMGVNPDRPNKHKAWGVEFEAQARIAYEAESGNLVEETGFWVSDYYAWLGASPDGLVGHDGLVEVKCPSKIPTEIPVAHAVQMLVQLAVTGRKWCDYYAWSQAGSFLKRIHHDSLIGPLGIADILLQLEGFYRAYVETKTPPMRGAKPCGSAK